jgi:hypothetical protein
MDYHVPVSLRAPRVAIVYIHQHVYLFTVKPRGMFTTSVLRHAYVIYRMCAPRVFMVYVTTWLGSM